MSDNETLRLLEDIKKLLILGLIDRSVQTTAIADVLGVNKSTISRLVPARKIKKKSDAQ